MFELLIVVSIKRAFICEYGHIFTLFFEYPEPKTKLIRALLLYVLLGGLL